MYQYINHNSICLPIIQKGINCLSRSSMVFESLLSIVTVGIYVRFIHILRYGKLIIYLMFFFYPRSSRNTHARGGKMTTREEG